MNRALAMLGGGAAGAGLMYLLDPGRGNRRRARLRDQAIHAAHLTGDAVDATARDAMNRSRGLLAALRPRFRDDPRSPESQLELLQTHWTPTARLLTAAGGGALAIYGVARRDAPGAFMGAAGLGLLARGLTNLPLKRLPGVGAGRRAVDVQKTITIDAPVERVFDFWTHYENFPRFMSHVREVRGTPDGQSHWVVAGPAGAPVEWDAVVTQYETNRVLAWKTLPGSVVGHAGTVRFDPNPDGSTRLDIKLSYNPPAGAAGHVAAALFGTDPKHAMDDDLLRLKSLLEEGKATADGEVVTRQELNTEPQTAIPLRHVGKHARPRRQPP
jgi:uncharacterized membrane protein